jgi:NADPH-dependent curcumin reductase CurA
MFNIVVNRLTIRGMRVGDHAARLPDLRRELLPELTSGRLRSCETVCSGLHNAPQALADLLRGVSTGRVLVEL